MGCDGIWEKKSNEEAVKWVYEALAKNGYNGDPSKIDIKQIVADLLLENLAPDVTSSGGVGCDNMTCILILFDKSKLWFFKARYRGQLKR